MTLSSLPADFSICATTARGLSLLIERMPEGLKIVDKKLPRLSSSDQYDPCDPKTFDDTITNRKSERFLIFYYFY